MQKLAKLKTKTSNKVCKPETYNKIVNDLVNRNRWQEAINKQF